MSDWNEVTSVSRPKMAMNHGRPAAGSENSLPSTSALSRSAARSLIDVLYTLLTRSMSASRCGTRASHSSNAGLFCCHTW